MKTNQIVLSAIRWWTMLRPAQWSVEQHLAQPTVNCRGEYEFELAEAVASAIREKK